MLSTMLRALLQRNGTLLLGGFVLHFIWFAQPQSYPSVFGLSHLSNIVCSSRVCFFIIQSIKANRKKITWSAAAKFKADSVSLVHCHHSAHFVLDSSAPGGGEANVLLLRLMDGVELLIALKCYYCYACL